MAHWRLGRYVAVYRRLNSMQYTLVTEWLVRWV